MSLPPGFLDELRSRSSMAQVAGGKVLWDARKSNQGKGDMWAPCPFHQEKTASFHVDDRKGFYYCFGCHAKGDVISFVRETENVGFMEAIEILAREAGMTMPARDPKAQEKADRRTVLTEAMEAALRHYKMQLRTAAAGPARDYLARRGLDEAAQERWEIAYAPDQRRGLFDALTSGGTDADALIDAGLCAKPDDGGAPYDRFRGRILFPIRDGRGKLIAFGGRSLDPEARAKYLNSPETDLFDKGRSLYNYAPAREAVGKSQPLIVAEGYMDVIALAEAGFTGAVAPLGTAITENQIDLLWRIAPEPIIALDGDKAGLRAAMRLIDIVLPKLEAGRTLRFAIMPEGQDPDDLIKAGGAGAMQARLDEALPLVSLLWQRETEGQVFDSPERKAALDSRLRKALAVIPDPSVRRHYGDEINQLRQALFRPQRATGPRRGMPHVPVGATQGTKNSPLVAGAAGFGDALRERVILATLVHHPKFIEVFEDALERMEPMTPETGAILNILLTIAPDDIGSVNEKIGAERLELLMSQRHVRIAPSVQTTAEEDLVRLCLAEEFAILAARRGAEREIADAMADAPAAEDEGLTWRVKQAAEALHGPRRGEETDEAEFDIADNGVRLNRDERAASRAIFDAIDFEKTKGRGR